MTSDGNKGISSITYDYRNLPLSMTTSAGTVSYFYNDNGLRVQKQAPGKNEYYLYDQTGRELASYDLSTGYQKSINIHGSGLIGRLDVTWPGGVRTLNKFFFVKDHLGSIRWTLNQSGTLVSARDYYVFGETLREYTTGLTERFKFTEKERDSETNYDYFGARYYDSELGRWMSVDPMKAKYPGWSPYNYCLNNPLKVIDPDGKVIWIQEMMEDGSERLVRYERGMIANDKSNFINKIIRFLNNINYDTQAGGRGGEVVGALAGAINQDFTVSNKASKLAAAHFAGDPKGGGALYMGKDPDIGTLAHELFHGYMHLFGYGGSSHWEEVQAYGFQAMITGVMSFGRREGNHYEWIAAQNYQVDMVNFVKNLDILSFNEAITLFQSGSEANRKGLYDIDGINKYKLIQDNQKTKEADSFINKFWRFK